MGHYPFFDFSILRTDPKLHALHTNWNIRITHSHRVFQRTNGGISGYSSFFFCISPLWIVWLCDTEPAGALAILFSLYYAFPSTYCLFGLSAILFSLLHTPEIPEQRIEEPEMEKGEIAKSVISSSVFGSMVSFLPGSSSAHATVMAMLARINRQPEQVYMTRKNKVY